MHEVFCLVMFEFPNRYAYVYVPVISSFLACVFHEVVTQIDLA